MKQKNENDKKNNSTLKKLGILFALILIIFGLVNVVWFFGYKNIYNEFSKKMDVTYDEIDSSIMRYTKIEGDLSFYLKMPSYLGSGGFLSVGSTQGYTSYIDEDGNVVGSNGMYITLYIWPQMGSGYKVGVDFYDEFADIWEQVYIDAELNLLNTDNYDDLYIEELEELIQQNSEYIRALINAAEDLWDLQL